MKEPFLGRYLIEHSVSMITDLDLDDLKLRRAAGEVRMSIRYSLNLLSHSYDGEPMVCVDWETEVEEGDVTNSVVFYVHCVFKNITRAEGEGLLGELIQLLQEEVFSSHQLTNMWVLGTGGVASVEPDVKTTNHLKALEEISCQT